jgi:TIGR03009 family protein
MRAWMLGIAITVIPSLTFAQNTKGSGTTTQKGAPQNSKAAPTGKEAAPVDKNAAAKSSETMEKILRGWESKSRTVKDVECEFRRISKDAIFKTEEIEYGKASGIKPYQGRLDLRDSNGAFTQIFIYTGKRLYQYDFKAKQEIIHNLPEPDPANQSMPGPLGFVYGMSATEAKTRFDMKLVKQFTVDNADYAEIHATPRTQADQQDFSFARIVIDLKTYLPKELKLVEPNGNEQHWLFDRLETNLKPPVSSKDLEPFDRNKIKALESWKQVINNFGDQPAANDAAPKSKSTGQSKSTTPAKTTEAPRTPVKK